MSVTRKTEIGPVDGTPLKRLFWSIISDYDLKTGLCELVDNAIDLWTTSGRKGPLEVSVDLDAEQQRIFVRDNSGGVKVEDLRFLVAPGGSRNRPDAEVIGVFGVGGKRAGIALGEHVEIKTRYKSKSTHQLDITKDWLGQEDWELPVYVVPDIAPGTTEVEILRLRKPLDRERIADLAEHFGEVYAWFIAEGCRLVVNGKKVTPTTFHTWAFPKGYPPKRAVFDISLDEGRVQVDIVAGLITDRKPEADNYGVYVYCNNRLIVKELRTRDVGYFVTAEAGVPHADASLCRALVRLQGPAQGMPWNSSKSGVNAGHAVFQRIRPTLIQLVSYFSSLSRRLKHEWNESVIPRTSGSIEMVPAGDVPAGGRLALPSLPRVNRPQVERIKATNRRSLRDTPWTLGLVEAMAAVSIITRQRLDTKNRIALILLDSNFEIALKEFIVHRTDLFPRNAYDDAKIQRLFKNRQDVIREVTAKVAIPQTLLGIVAHFYALRNKLIHERATVGITDADVNSYKKTIQDILKLLFGLKF